MKKTPLYQVHVDAGGKLVDFGGWNLPVQYSGIQSEHKAVRTQAGLFDVSHMGEVTVEGPEAEAYLNHVVTNDVARLVDGQALYTVMCRPDGGIVDDLIIYKRNREKFFICVNASNTDKDFAWFQENRGTFKVDLKNLSDQYCQIAVQGPNAPAILQKLVKPELAKLGYFHFVETDVLGKNALIARTGYTGEDGFEIYLPAAHGPAVWKALMETGKPLGLIPCGLGARDTLRLEAALALYGNDIGDDTNPLEAGLGWVVKLQKSEFNGKAVLEKVKQAGTQRKLSGIRMLERVIPRHDYEVFTADGAKKIGKVTSGTLSPTLDFPIAMAYIDSQHTGDAKVSVKIRDKFYPGEITKLPFYRRKKDE